jgi:hypothetical protein
MVMIAYSGTYPTERPSLRLVPHVQPPEADEPKPSGRGIYRDLGLLVPQLQQRVIAMVATLEAAGYAPRVWETYRTVRRCEMLKARGSSQSGTRSLHRFGAACDIVCARHLWGCGKAGCDYFVAQGVAARASGLYWGGDWRSFVDRPHVQIVAVRHQNLIRRADDVAALLEQRPELMRRVA